MELWDIVLRYRWRFVCVAFTVGTLVLTASLLLPRKYRASAIFERRTDMVLTEMSHRGATRSFQDPKPSLLEEISGQPAVDGLLRSLAPVLQEKGLIHSEADRLALRDDLWRHTIVHWDISSPDLDRVRIEYTARDPELAQLAVNGLIANYIERARTAMESRLRESQAFFEGEAARHRQAIEKLENAILEFEMENGALLPETPNNLQEKLASISDTLTETISLRDAAQLRLEALRKQLDTTPATLPSVVTSRNPELDRLGQKLEGLRHELNTALNVQKMTERHPDVVILRNQIKQVEEQIAGTEVEIVTQKQTAVNPRRAELETQIAQIDSQHRAYSDQVEALKRQIDQLSGSMDSMFEIRSKHRKMNRDLADAQRQLGFWEDNLRRVEMALAAESGNRGIQLHFLQPASVNPRPVSPNLAQVVLAAVMLGLMSGALTVFLSYRSDTTFLAGEELAEAMNLPLVGAVSEVVTKRHRRVRHVRRLVLYPTAVAAMLTVFAGVAGILYLELEKPGALDDYKEQAAAIAGVLLSPAQAAAATPVSVAPADATDVHTDDHPEDQPERH